MAVQDYARVSPPRGRTSTSDMLSTVSKPSFPDPSMLRNEQRDDRGEGLSSEVRMLGMRPLRAADWSRASMLPFLGSSEVAFLPLPASLRAF